MESISKYSTTRDARHESQGRAANLSSKMACTILVFNSTAKGPLALWRIAGYMIYPLSTPRPLEEKRYIEAG